MPPDLSSPMKTWPARIEHQVGEAPFRGGYRKIRAGVALIRSGMPECGTHWINPPQVHTSVRFLLGVRRGERLSAIGRQVNHETTSAARSLWAAALNLAGTAVLGRQASREIAGHSFFRLDPLRRSDEGSHCKMGKDRIVILRAGMRFSR